MRVRHERTMGCPVPNRGFWGSAARGRAVHHAEVLGNSILSHCEWCDKLHGRRLTHAVMKPASGSEFLDCVF